MKRNYRLSEYITILILAMLVSCKQKPTNSINDKLLNTVGEKEQAAPCQEAIPSYTVTGMVGGFYDTDETTPVVTVSFIDPHGNPFEAVYYTQNKSANVDFPTVFPMNSDPNYNLLFAKQTQPYNGREYRLEFHPEDIPDVQGNLHRVNMLTLAQQVTPSFLCSKEEKGMLKMKTARKAKLYELKNYPTVVLKEIPENSEFVVHTIARIRSHPELKFAVSSFSATSGAWHGVLLDDLE